MTRALLRQMRASARALLAFTVICTAILAGSYLLTRDAIDQRSQQERQRLIAQTLPPGSFDNALARDWRELRGEDAALLGQPAGSRVYIARQAGKPVALVFETVAGNGYAGRIRLLVGVLADGRVSGVRVVEHRETPGLGDYIDSEKSVWAAQFVDKTLANRWQVKKDGGDFDYMAGATVSARAVVAAVGRTLTVFRRRGAALLQKEQA
ncbi:electron transport complex subunit RsxG [Xenophilus sp. AP218F]|nr:electron transport complex subunit RsxG [Xenophilus sp. AP218F]